MNPEIGELVQSTNDPNVWIVRVNAGELQCDSRPLPYPTTIGTVAPLAGKSGRINVWSPVASKPRGYRAAARAVLESKLAEKRKELGFGPWFYHVVVSSGHMALGVFGEALLSEAQECARKAEQATGIPAYLVSREFSLRPSVGQQVFRS